MIVTNAGWVCRSFDRLLLTHSGRVAFDGCWDRLVEFEGGGEELDLVPETVDAVRVLMENPPYGRYAVHT